MDLQYFKTIQGFIGTNCKNDVVKKEVKANLKEQLLTSINKVDGKRNGKEQTFIVTPSKVSYKYNIEALPDEDLFIGDEIECCGHHWIVVEVEQCNPIQKIGLMWLCNLELKFQNFDSVILSQWVVLDSGVYSTTLTNNKEVQQLNKQFKLYSPYNKNTKKLYIDKRIATDIKYDAYGNEILEVFKITGTNRVARSYGNGSHLLICELRSDEHNKETDNKELLICDYITENVTDSVNLKSKIVGREFIPLGTTRKYESRFYDENENKINITNVNWNIESNINDLIVQQEEDFVSIFVPDNENYVGKNIKLSMADSDLIYPMCNFEIEVVAI